MFSLPKRILLSAAVAALFGCGGTGSVKNPAHLRVLNAFTATDDIRVYVGDHLYSGNGVGPALSYGNRLSYGNVPSGTVNIVANPYVDTTTTYASLTSQNLFAGNNYTVVGMTVGGTKRLVLFDDGVSQSTDTAYFRIIDASPTVSPVYVVLRRASDDVIVYQSSTTTPLTVGNSTGYRSLSATGTDPTTYKINVYSSSSFSNSLSGDIEVDLAGGSPKTLILYDKTSGGVAVKTGTDVSDGS